MIAGLTLCALIAAGAYVCGLYVPQVGGPVFGIVFGMIVATTLRPGSRFADGIAFAGKQVLQASIVLLGATLQLGEVVRGGWHSLPLMLGTAIVTLTAAFFLGNMLRIDRDLRRLLGVGTTICGGSAIAALAGVIDVDRTEMAYAISTVFLFNVAAVLTFPSVGHALRLSQHAFGLFAGTAINDTSSVVAAGYVYGHAAGTEAVIVKLTRTLLIIPLVLFYAVKRVLAARGQPEAIHWGNFVPWFIAWFVLAAVANTFGLIPAAAHPAITRVALFLIVVALTGIGLSVKPAAIRAAGARPMLLGGILWAIIAVSSLYIARAMHLS